MERQRLSRLIRTSKRSLPNILSLLRIVGVVSIVFCDIDSVAFWMVYSLCGISDIADGWLARKFNSVTKSGAMLDSLADICFVVCCGSRLLSILELPLWFWLWIGIIFVIKTVNQVSALIMYGKCHFPHTTANKETGFLLFITVPMMFWSLIPIALVAVIATYAAIQEGHIIRTQKARNTTIERMR